LAREGQEWDTHGLQRDTSCLGLVQPRGCWVVKIVNGPSISEGSDWKATVNPVENVPLVN